MPNNIMFVDKLDRVLLQEMPRKIAARPQSYESMMKHYDVPKTKLEIIEQFLNILSWKDVPRSFEDSRAIKLRKNNMENTLMNSDVINRVVLQRNSSEKNNSLSNDDFVIEPLSYDVNKVFSTENVDNTNDIENDSLTYSESSLNELDGDNQNLISTSDDNLANSVPDVFDDKQDDSITYSDSSLNELDNVEDGIDVPLSGVEYNDINDLQFDNSDANNEDLDEVDSTIDISVPDINESKQFELVNNISDDSNIFEQDESDFRLPRGGQAAKISNYETDLVDSNTFVAVPSFNDIVIKDRLIKIPKLDDILISPEFESGIDNIDNDAAVRDVPIVVEDRDDKREEFTVSFDEDLSNSNDLDERKMWLETLREKVLKLEATRVQVNDAKKLSEKAEQAREESDVALEGRMEELKKIESAVDDTYKASLEEKRMYEAKIIEAQRIKEKNDQNIKELDSVIEEYSSSFRR